MKVGIIEICEPNHYSAVEALVQTYAVEPQNQIIVYTLKEFLPLLNFSQTGISIEVKKDTESIAAFLNRIANSSHNRLHINTLSKFYNEFSIVNWQGCIYFTVHNTDIFFANSFWHRTRLLLLDTAGALKKINLKGLKDFTIQYIKDFKRQAYRNSFIKKLLRTDYRIIVYSQSQKKHLERHVQAKKIVVFPFCLHEKTNDLSALNKKVRICIPGTVTNKRRDYNGLVKLINTHPEFFNTYTTIDLLGYIYKDELCLANEFLKLKESGLDIIYNTTFIDTEEFDARLNQADIILGNLKVQVNPYRKYGETKETGVIFNVIKAGKPALLPQEYAVDSELLEVCIFYADVNQLYKIINGLTFNKTELNRLKAKAMSIADNYTPKKLYHLLVN